MRSDADQRSSGQLIIHRLISRIRTTTVRYLLCHELKWIECLGWVGVSLVSWGWVGYGHVSQYSDQSIWLLCVCQFNREKLKKEKNIGFLVTCFGKILCHFCHGDDIRAAKNQTSWSDFPPLSTAVRVQFVNFINFIKSCKSTLSKWKEETQTDFE